MRLIIFLSQLLILSMLYAQELCNNGIDDDGDGLVDCFDGDCSFDGSCDGFFFGNSAICTSEPNESLGLKEQWRSKHKSSTSHASLIVGDLDLDGRPEVVTVNSTSKELFILNGQTGEVKASVQLPFEPSNTPLLADIDNDGKAEVFLTEKDGDNFALYIIDEFLNPVEQWSRKASSNQSIGAAGIADFDGDGDAEIYYRNEIIDAKTGDVLIEGSGNWVEDYVHAPLAIDILPTAACSDCSGLELVTGNEIWSVNVGNRTLTLVSNMDDDIRDDIDPTLQYFPKLNASTGNQWSAVSSADYNVDGDLDLLVTGALGTAAEDGSGESTVFLWEPSKGIVQRFTDPVNNAVNGPGKVAIADVDLDGLPNAVFTMGTKLYTLNENLSILWTHEINESFTAPTIFDLNHDSENEVLVKDGTQLLILKGAGNGDNTTSSILTATCQAISEEESVIVADIDGDGSVEVCVSCFTNDQTLKESSSNAELSQVRVFEGEGSGWTPGRSVWNQFNYYNVNINEDLSIPIEVQDHSVVFSSAGSCDFSNGSPIPFPTRSLNNFGVQSTFLDEEGCVSNVSPDFAFVGQFNITNILNCVLNDISTTFQLTNIGDRSISGTLPIAYYWGDPRNNGSILLDVQKFPLSDFGVGEVIDVDHEVDGIPDAGDIYVVLNDDGTTTPFTSFPMAGFLECDTDGNIQFSTVEFGGASTNVFKEICEGDTFQFGSQMLTEAGEYMETFPDADPACQSVTLTLTVNSTYNESASRTICAGDVFVFGSEILTEAGDYSHTFQSANTCDSVVNLTLAVEALEAQVSVSERVLSVVEVANATYQWINCATDSPIEGATSLSFNPGTSGSYAVTVRSAICETTSECFDVIVLSSAFEKSMQVFPNPFTEYLTVQLPEITTGTFQLIDLTGKIILQDDFYAKSKFQIQTNKVEKGLYVLEIFVKDQKRRVKVIRE